jgi:hypothetical protein
MITRTIIAAALTLGPIAGALAETKQPISHPPRESASEPRNSYIPADPDLNVRWEMRRDPSDNR